MNERRHSMQKTLMIVANADKFAPRHQPVPRPKPVSLAVLPPDLRAKSVPLDEMTRAELELLPVTPEVLDWAFEPLPQEAMCTEPVPDPPYMDRKRNPNWRGTHD